MNIKSEMRLNKITCQFEDRELEKEFLHARWEKTWSYIKILLYFNVPLGFIIRIDDLFIRGAGMNPYYIGYHIFAIALLIIFLISSSEKRQKYYQIYFLIEAIGFMNCGAWTYYFSDIQFPVGSGVIPNMILIYLVLFPFNLINGIIATLGTSIPFAIVVISEGNMTPDQLSYVFLCPLYFL